MENTVDKWRVNGWWTLHEIHVHRSQEVMETDQYNLRWHYHHSETFLAFESLRRSDSFVDVVLSCEKRSIFAHKLVLSACSNYFFDVLRSVREGQMPVLFFRDTTMDLLESVVHYIYHGEVEIPSARITDFINLAEALEIKGAIAQFTSL